MKKLILLAVLLLGIAVLGIAVSPLGTVIGDMIHVTFKHRNLQGRSDCHEIGREMAKLLHDPAIEPNHEIFSNDKRMPERLRKLYPKCFRVNDRRSASLVFGGGFYQYGYSITATGSDGEYRMTCFGEEPEETVDLGTFK